MLSITITLDISTREQDDWQRSGPGMVLEADRASSAALMALLKAFTDNGGVRGRHDAAAMATLSFSFLPPAAKALFAPAFEGYLET